MLKRRAKKRYLAIIHGAQETDPFKALVERCIELFGHVATQKATLKLIRSDTGHILVRCAQSQLEKVLVATALTNPPLVVLDMSASLKRLKKRLYQKPGQQTR